MKITIQAFTLQGFNLAPEIVDVFLRVYALNYFVAQSDSRVIQPASPSAGPFYDEWQCTRSGSNLQLPEIALESTIDALSPAHPEGIRYFAGFFDPGGNMLAAMWPKPIFALDINPNPTTWAHIAAYNSPGVEFDWTTTHAEHYSKEEFDYLLQNPPAPTSGGGFVVLPPLQFDGATLFIPRASAVQDGYLAAEDFVAFSGGGSGMGVISFNSRQGVIVLLSTDVASALGYTALNKAGDTMTGPLLLQAGDPPAPLAAATRAYVDTHAGTDGGPTTLPGEYLLSSFGASGSIKRFTGATTLGLPSLTLSPGSANDFAIGQGIFITGGAGGGVDLLTKVDAVAGLVLTLHDAAGVTLTAANVQHDDTVAIQAGINAVIATTTVTGLARGGTLIFDGDFYRINGPIDPAYNAIVHIPYNPTDSTHTNPVIKLKGYVPNRMPTFIGPPGESVVIQTDKIVTSAVGGNGVIEAWMLSTGIFYGGSDPTPANSTTVYMEDLTWRTYLDPQIGGIDFGMCAEPILKNIVVDIAVGSIASGWPMATHHTCGIRLPRVNITGLCYTENIWVGGFDIGIIATEEWVCTYCGPSFCNIGIRFDAGFHMTGPIRATVFWCRTFVQWTGRLTVDVVLDTELEPSRLISGRVLYDPDNNAYGEVRYFGEMTGSGALTPPDYTGCSHLRISDLNGFQSKEPSTDIATLSISGEPAGFGVADSGGSGYRQVIVPNYVVTDPLWVGLLSYWSMNEATSPRLDAMGNNSLTGGALPLAGLFGQAASTAYLSAPDNPTQDIAGGMTIAGWVQIHVPTDGFGFHTVLAKWGASGQNSFILNYNNSATPSPGWEFQVTNDGIGGTGGTQSKAYVPGAATVDTWYHVAAVYDEVAHEIRLRVNDGAIGSATTAFTGPLAPSTAGLGCMIFGSTIGNMAVEELGWWNRALTLSQITQLYNSGNGITYPYSTLPSTLLQGLTSYWTLDETGSGVRLDKMGSNHFEAIGAPASHPGIPAGAGAVSSASGTAYLRVMDNPSQSFAGSMTIAGWVAVHNYATPFHTILAKWSGTNGGLSFFLLWRSDSPGGRFEVQVCATGNTPDVITLDLPNTPAIDAWTFVTFVYDHAAHQISLSINNGTPVTASFTGPIFYYGPSGVEMRTMNFDTATGDMYVDELGVWARTLTTAEITALWNGGSGRTFPFA